MISLAKRPKVKCQQAKRLKTAMSQIQQNKLKLKPKWRDSIKYSKIRIRRWRKWSDKCQAQVCSISLKFNRINFLELKRSQFWTEDSQVRWCTLATFRSKSRTRIWPRWLLPRMFWQKCLQVCIAVPNKNHLRAAWFQWLLFLKETLWWWQLQSIGTCRLSPDSFLTSLLPRNRRLDLELAQVKAKVSHPKKARKRWKMDTISLTMTLKMTIHPRRNPWVKTKIRKMTKMRYKRINQVRSSKQR